MTLAWVIFRADTLRLGALFIGNMFGINSSGLVDETFIASMGSGLLIIVAAAMLSAPVYPKTHAYISQKNARLDRGLRAVLCFAIFLLSIFQVAASTYSPFIYFNF